MFEHIILNEHLFQTAARLGVPYTASIELLTKCNYRCVHCYIPQHNKEMPYNIVIDAIRQVKDLGAFEITFTGGEIFLRKDIWDILLYARKLGLRVTLFTNISLFTPAMIAQLAEMYISEISTTLFSLDPDINDSITSHIGSRNEVLKNAQLIKESGIKLEIKVPIMKMNVDHYADIAEYCKKEGFRFNFTTAITARTDGDTEPCKYLISQGDLNRVMREIENFSSLGQFNPDDMLCSAVANSLHIDVDGNVSPCVSFPVQYGNIYSLPLKEIWEKSQMRELLLQAKRRILSECSNCSLAQYCTRCPGLALTEDKTFTGCSHLDKAVAIARRI